MKNLLLIAGIVLATFSSIFCNSPGGSGHTTTGSTSDEYTSAVKVSQSEWDDLTSRFKLQNENLTLGGILNKTDLQNMLDSLSDTDTLVLFRFTTDETYHQTSVAFSGGESAKDVSSIRNGGDKDAFCPSACNLICETNPRAVFLSFDDFKVLGNEYERKNPDVTTWGGNIDKSALLAIINSIQKEENNINFRFCSDPRYEKTSVIFMGGSEGQPSGDVLYLRNGKSTESFCPHNCSFE